MVQQVEFDVNFGDKPFAHSVFANEGFKSVHSSLFV
jgi:hypothetical protein